MTPIFIVGCERSGTTLLGAMFGSHPDVICVPEAQFLYDLMPDADPRRPVDAGELLRRLGRHWRFRLWRFPVERIEIDPARTYSYAGFIEAVIRSYAAHHGREAPKFWAEHWPNKIAVLARLSGHFPDARVIHIVRDGRAVAASLLPLPWGPNDIREAAHHWAIKLAFGHSAAAFLGPERCRTVRYEDLVMQPVETMQLLAAHVGLPYHPSLLETTGLAVPAYTRGQHALVGKPPDPARIEKWKTQLSAREIEIFEHLTGDLLTYHGYELLAGMRPRPLSLAEKIGVGERWLRYRILNKARSWWRRQRFAA